MKKDYPCKECGRILTTNYSLKEHRKNQHQSNNFAAIPCNICDNKFHSHSNLTTHVKTVHEGFKVSCNQCGREFGQKSTLKRHRKIVHEGFRFKCDKCNYTSVGKNIVKKHLEDHH